MTNTCHEGGDGGSAMDAGTAGRDWSKYYVGCATRSNISEALAQPWGLLVAPGAQIKTGVAHVQFLCNIARGIGQSQADSQPEAASSTCSSQNGWATC